MEDRIGPHLLDDRAEGREVDDVQLAQVCLLGDPGGVAGGEIIDHGHGMAVGQQRVDHV